MSDRDDKLRAGGSAPAHDEIDPDAPPSAEEVAASQRLRDALAKMPKGLPADRDLDLVKSLRAAWSPDPLDASVHAELLDELPGPEELALAAELRDALEGNERATDPDVVVALRSAWSPAELGADEHRAIVARALGEAGAGTGNVVAFKPRARAVRVVVVTTTTVLALAASVVVWITNAPPGPSEAPLAKARSTQPLFGEPFKAGETSARIDRIAIARSSDYRDNRFAKWGVR
jgi:hypothetical protein